MQGGQFLRVANALLARLSITRGRPVPRLVGDENGKVDAQSIAHSEGHGEDVPLLPDVSSASLHEPPLCRTRYPQPTSLSAASITASNTCSLIASSATWAANMFPENANVCSSTYLSPRTPPNAAGFTPFPTH